MPELREQLTMAESTIGIKQQRIDDLETALAKEGSVKHECAQTAKNRLARVRELEMALRNYGRHSDTCAMIMAGEDCDCGLAELLETFRD
jgi:vacuolar-type H+-ATPase subunit I/STV1